MTDQENKEEALTIETINKMIHAAITKRNQSIDSQFNELKQLMQQQLNKSNTTATEEEVDKKPTRLAVVENELKTLQKTLQDKESLIRQKELEDKLSTYFKKHGVLDEFLPAIQALVEKNKLATYDDSGSMVFKDHISGEYTDLDSGVRSWMKANGQAFVAAKDIRGTGLKGFRKSVSSNNPATQYSDEELVAMLDSD